MYAHGGAHPSKYTTKTCTGNYCCDLCSTSSDLLAIMLSAIGLPRSWTSAGNVLGPMLAGAVSRGVAGVATAPLELARTRMQAAQRSGAQSTRFWQQLVPPPGATPLQRFTFLWTGQPQQGQSLSHSSLHPLCKLSPMLFGNPDGHASAAVIQCTTRSIFVTRRAAVFSVCAAPLTPFNDIPQGWGHLWQRTSPSQRSTGQCWSRCGGRCCSCSAATGQPPGR